MKLIIFVAGVALGFVIGSRAGRGAYENMRRTWQGFSDSDPVRKVKGDVRGLAGRAASDLGDAVSEAVGKASDKLDEVTGKPAAAGPETTPTEA